ncbi:MAG: glycine--tRNA ligase subunit beta, partial [Burkholderiaceae bacterium]
MTHTLLLELFTEELPPKALSRLGDSFAHLIREGLASRGFLDTATTATAYATPRRLAVKLNSVRSASPDKAIREKVLPVNVALDQDGQPTAPLQKKLAALAVQVGRSSITLAELERANDGKAESFFFSYMAPGQPLATGLQSVLDESITKLPIPKVMSYQRPDGVTVQFVRPVHGLMALLDDQIVPLRALGLASGRTTLGHRFLSAQTTLTVASANQYEDVLREQGKVIASFEERKQKIQQDLLEAAGDD